MRARGACFPSQFPAFFSGAAKTSAQRLLVHGKQRGERVVPVFARGSLREADGRPPDAPAGNAKLKLDTLRLWWVLSWRTPPEIVDQLCIALGL